MKINIIQNNKNYYLQIEDITQAIKKYIIKKSWDSSYKDEILTNSLPLYEKNVLLFKQEINMVLIKLPLDELQVINELYFIEIVFDNDTTEEIYIDYNTFHNIKCNEKIYIYDFQNREIENQTQTLYKIYLKGNYGDLHQANLLYRINENKALIQVPNITYKSETYDIILEKNKQIVYRSQFPMITKNQIEFSIIEEDCGEYLKLNVFPKKHYKILKQIYFNYKGNTIPFDNEIFILKNDFEDKFIINYTLEDTAIDKTTVQQSFYYHFRNVKNEIIKAEYNYSYMEDALKIKLNTKNDIPLNYKYSINEDIFFTNAKIITINNFSKYNNNNIEIDINVFYSLNNKYNQYFSFKVPNYMRINKLEKFIPVIDYSDCLDVHKKQGTLSWSVPSCKFYAKIKVNVLNIKQFLDEYTNVWNKQYILDDVVSKFDERYTDYEKIYEYDFEREGEKFLKTPNDCLISYDSLKNGFVNIGETNQHKLDLWFCEKGHTYQVTIEIYNLWGKKVGENTVNFGLYDNYIGEVTESMLIFGRNQYMQFGESGTVGEFYKINNPTPINTMKSYASKYKTFTGKALYNQANIDNNCKPLYYYMNTNTDNYFFIKYMRSYNFYNLEYKLFNEGNDTPVLIENHEPNGNDYDSNIIKIRRDLFKEGTNTMQIKVYNSEGISSDVKEFNFLVSNNKPNIPHVIINNEDFSLKDDVIVINKKYFQLFVTNNAQSNKYAGWIFKEAHFFFKKPTAIYNEYADYVVLASKDDGSIVLNNNTEIENGEYDCKVITYDYFGNPSDPYEFHFKLTAELKIQPEVLFTNKVDVPFKWNITKAEDSEGFYYYFKYSEDGIHYEKTEPIKIESPYYIKDPNTKPIHELSLNWLKDNYLKYKEGIYILVVYEYNLKHPNGLPDYEFESVPVEVRRISNASFPIYAKKTDTNNIVNEKKSNEYSYTSDINAIEFETIHNVDIFDDPATPEKEGQKYSIELIAPNKNKYFADLPLPEKIGMYKFSKILDKTKVQDPIEGVWELRFITIDKFGNSNAYKGYYTYYIVYLKRNPKITILNPNTTNNSNIFGLNSTNINFITNTSEIYSDILNFEEHKEKFVINNFKMKMNYNPYGSNYEINLTSQKNMITVLNNLTENDKITHARDGKYSITVSCSDLLGRESNTVDRIFYIDTKINGELLFVNNNIFNSRVVDIIGIASGEVTNVYYTTEEGNEDIKTWNKASVGYIEYNSETIYGIIISNLSFDSDGKKFIKYILEEESGNRTTVQYYYFNIDTEIKLIPIFDYTNKIYYLNDDKNLHFTWNLTNEDVNHFYYKLDRIKITETGETVIEESFMPSSNGTLLPVGPGKNDFSDIGDSRSLTIPLEKNGWLITGYYNLTIKSFNIYGTTNNNNFRFNINLDIPVNLEYEMINNKITLSNNIISWNHIKEASHYEVSYDGFNWIKVIDNKFIINPDSVIKDNNDKTYLYMRWRSYNGVYSNVSKIEIYLSIIKLKTPSIYWYENKILTENNGKIEWKINIPDVPNAKYLYYSFDNTKWYIKKINNSLETIVDDIIEYPVKDGRYGIFVRTTDGHPTEDSFINKSDIAYSYVDIFAEPIPKPIFSGISNGATFNIPIKLIIENKIPNVQYFIYVNNLPVPEGFEIASYILERYNITVKCKKQGIEKIHTILDVTDNFHLYSKVEESYQIFIGNQKAICYIDSENENFIVQSMPNKRNIEVILYREKHKTNWNRLQIGDRLSLNKEWEFKITTFEIL